MPSSGVAGRVGFRPRLAPTLAAATVFLLLVALGVWQVFRLQEKAAINEYRSQRAALAPVPLPADPAALSRFDVARYDFRRVRVEGRFENDRELYVYRPSREGGDAGYHVVTPLLRAGAPAVLVDRGWVPVDRKDPATRAAGEPSGPVTVTAFLRRGESQGWLTPANDAAQNSWFWFDLPAMSKAAGIAPPVRFYLEADATANPGGLPVGGQTVIALPSPHLNYAITWFSLAGILVVIFVASQRRQT